MDTEKLDFNRAAVIAAGVEYMAEHVFAISTEKGWWEAGNTRNTGEAIALMHSELSEALESDRHGDPPSDHIPEFSGVEEEMADVVIRVVDFCKGRNLRLADAILAKMEYNRNRPYKHGGKKY